ncbi:MAG: SRPBCC domain-containing protein [Chthoniobacterales bacterium]
MTTTPTVEKLSISRTFAATRDRVFAAWTDPDQAKQWFGPEGCNLVDLQIDFRVGGKYRFVVEAPSCEEANSPIEKMIVGGEYREITPPSRLVYTWQWEDDEAYVNHETLITIDFIAKGDSTEIRLTHENLPSELSRGRHEYGWNGCLDKFAKLLAS